MLRSPPITTSTEQLFPHTTLFRSYVRQIYWGSGVDLPEEKVETLVEEFILEALELPAGEKAIISLQLPEGFVIVFEPVTHAAQFLDVKGEPTKERQALSLVFDRGHRHHETLVLHPVPLRIAVDNSTNVRTLPDRKRQRMNSS